MKTLYKSIGLVALCLIYAMQLSAQSTAPIQVGKASELKSLFEGKAQLNKSKKLNPQIIQKIPNQSSLTLQLTSSKTEGEATLYHGEVKDKKNSSFYMKIKDQEVTGAIILRDDKKYYEYTASAQGVVSLTEKNIDKVLCVSYAMAPENIEPKVTASSGTANISNLESNPGAAAVVLLDFDGQTVENTLWNWQSTDGAPIHAEPAVLSDDEKLEVWKMMSEDFIPFALNVTTSEAVFNSVPANRRVRVIFTPTNYFFPGAGGAAYVGSFNFADYYYGETPAFVWNAGAKFAGEAGSHEVGHTLSLVHDGRVSHYNEEYYYGHDNWAPIMGVGYYRSVVQWSKGEYDYASNSEDDLQMITTLHGFGYRADDHGNTTASATPLVIGEAGIVEAVSNKGIISTSTDVDFFSFTTSGGNVKLYVQPDPAYPNLDVHLNLRNASGSIVASADSYWLDALLVLDLPSGTYFLEVDGVKGDLGANSDYASLGQYFISGIIPSNQNPIVRITSPTNGQRFTAPATINLAATASDADGTIAKVEFFRNDIKLGEDTSAPYTYTWSGVAAGTYTLTAIATDNNGASTTSAPITINVAPAGNQSPVVRITSPTNGSSITIPQNPIQIIAAASDPDGSVAKVEFFSGTTKIGEDKTAPFTLSWRQPHVGKYSITARATDNKGASTTSAVVVVSVTLPGKGNMASVPKRAASSALTDGEIAELEVYPNLVTGQELIHVSLPTTFAQVRIIVHELSTGKKISEQIFTDTNYLEFDSKNLASGLYGLTITAEDKAWIRKVLVMPQKQ